MPNLVRFCSLMALSFALGGCGVAHYNKQSSVWEKGKAAIKAGISESDLRSCAGEPYRIAAKGDGADWYYGATIQLSGASIWCQLAIRMEGGKSTSFTTQSGNPGGLTNGEVGCGHVLDACVGDGMLDLETTSLGMQVTRMTRDSDATQAQRAGESSRNAALLGIAGSVANIAARQSPSPAFQASASDSSSNSSRVPASDSASNSADRKIWVGEMTSLCVRYRNLNVDRTTQAQNFEFENGCNTPIHIHYMAHPTSWSMADLKGMGSKSKSWYSTSGRFAVSEVRFVACRATDESGKSIHLDKAALKCYKYR